MAQWIARVTSDHKVGGSSPSEVAFFYYYREKDIKTQKYFWIFPIFSAKLKRTENQLLNLLSKENILLSASNIDSSYNFSI